MHAEALNHYQKITSLLHHLAEVICERKVALSNNFGRDERLMSADKKYISIEAVHGPGISKEKVEEWLNEPFKRPIAAVLLLPKGDAAADDLGAFSHFLQAQEISHAVVHSGAGLGVMFDAAMIRTDPTILEKELHRLREEARASLNGPLAQQIRQLVEGRVLAAGHTGEKKKDDFRTIAAQAIRELRDLAGPDWGNRTPGTDRGGQSGRRGSR